jgi:hypothetical protein
MTPALDLNALEGRLRGHVEQLARSPRLPGSPEHRRAAEYIRDQLLHAGFAVREWDFREGDLAGTNLLTEPLPDRPELPLMIWGAHYDTAPGSPGADDNASAVAALLELATWVQLNLGAAERPRTRLQLAAYDLEEWGYGGSMAHSREVSRARTRLRGMVSLEMLGYTDHRPGSQRLPPHLAGRYPDVGNFIGVCGNQASRDLLQEVTAELQSVPGLPVEFLAVPGNGELLPEVRLSDHSPFWDLGYQALMITDTSFFRNPHYHQITDTPDKLDYPFLARVTAGVCEAALRRLRQG